MDWPISQQLSKNVSTKNWNTNTRHGLTIYLIVTKGDMKKPEAEVRETMKKLENAGYRISPMKGVSFKRKQMGGT